MTFGVRSDAAGFIVETALIARRFIGQRLWNLARWMRSHGGFKFQMLGG
jgi:hypothetical protein